MAVFSCPMLLRNTRKEVRVMEPQKPASAASRGVMCGFVPRRLEIQGRPELGIFPFNVLFAKHGTRAGRRVLGVALYQPDLASFRRDANKCVMEYRNAYGGGSRLVIEYDQSAGRYWGQKLVNDQVVGMAAGGEWSIFFAHFTALGLTDGETCEFHELHSEAQNGGGAAGG
jgi:hypothetical protein